VQIGRRWPTQRRRPRRGASTKGSLSCDHRTLSEQILELVRCGSGGSGGLGFVPVVFVWSGLLATPIGILTLTPFTLFTLTTIEVFSFATFTIFSFTHDHLLDEGGAARSGFTAMNMPCRR
jgi:hypothetical protein